MAGGSVPNAYLFLLLHLFLFMQSRTSFQIQLAVLHALAIRELKTRFGKYRLGLAWAALEPLLQIMVFMAMFSFRDRSTLGGLELPIFLATGIAPFLYFKKVVTQSLGAVNANRNLLIYRQVRLFDPFLVRFGLEMVITLGVLIFLIGAAWYVGYEVQIVNTLVFLQAFLLLSFTAFGLGLFLGVINTLYPEPGKLIPAMLRPLMFISGTFFSINDLPRAAQNIIGLNPIIHALEFMRSAFSHGYDTSLVSMNYLALWALGSMFMGMLIFRANWRKMLTI